MPSMLLSSARRCRLYIAGPSDASALSDEAKNNRHIHNWLSAISDTIEKQVLGRELLIQSRTEYFDVAYGKVRYWPKAYPVTTLTSTYEDASGLWDGSESELTDSYIGTGGYEVVLPTTLSYVAPKALRVIYTGGLAYHAVNNTFTLSATGSWTANKYVIGSTSGAVGFVVSIDDTTLVVESYYGLWIEGETITEYNDEAGTDATGVSGTISSIDRASLAQAYPAIVSAVEVELRYMRKHMTDFENVSTDDDQGTSRRSPFLKRSWPLQPEAMNLLQPYVRMHGF